MVAKLPIIVSEETCAVYFWDDMSADDREVMKRQLVRLGLAEWAFAS